MSIFKKLSIVAVVGLYTGTCSYTTLPSDIRQFISYWDDECQN